MTEIVQSFFLNTDYFILLLFRVGALIVSSPIFGRVTIPRMVKIALAVSVTMMFFIWIPPVADIQYTSLIGFTLICAKEVLIGVALAYVTNAFFSIAYTAGQLIDMQIGFGIVNVYDPQNNSQIPMTGNMLNLVLLIVFFMVNGHLRLVQIIYITLEKLPVGNVTLSPDIAMVALEVFTMSFTLGVMVALPVIASGLILEITFGALMRTVPQMNMFVVGIPIKILIGFVVIIAILPVYLNFSDRIFTEMFSGIESMFSTFLAAA